MIKKKAFIKLLFCTPTTSFETCLYMTENKLKTGITSKIKSFMRQEEYTKKNLLFCLWWVLHFMWIFGTQPGLVEKTEETLMKFKVWKCVLLVALQRLCLSLSYGKPSQRTPRKVPSFPGRVWCGADPISHAESLLSALDLGAVGTEPQCSHFV